ncbi:hypothetical protein M9H77_18807 [Catharanthus roseus]|uniref:Uncharacterized protein n=1 Tax=Catharanthus roseus TaxID=4058 RepID=A0ACC0B8N1_CATRO|nr:hypothetical protein M9H77_18807 [Catharanthus roseus]
MEIADQTVIQKKAATGSAAPPYKSPGQGPWKLGDPKRPRGHVREQCPEMQRAPPKASKRSEEKNNKPQVKAKVNALDGLPVDTEAKVVEGTIQIFSQPAALFSPKLRFYFYYYIIAPDLHSGEGHSTVEGLANRYLRQTSHYALRWNGRLIESQEGLETKVGLKTDLVGDQGSVAWFYVNGECEAALMCLDSLRLPSCIQTPYNTCFCFDFSYAQSVWNVLLFTFFMRFRL